MAILQFMLSGRNTTAVPTSIHCDHLIQAHQGADRDVQKSLESEREIYDFLESAASRYGISFWKPGCGIIHQIVLENYAAPGGLMLGTDSHTPNAGGLGMLAVGVGGADAVDAMSSIPWELKAPKVLGVHLTGKLSGWASPKDVILYLAGQLSVRGGTGYIIEYFGPGVETLPCTGMATICNMGAEVGATTSLFPYNEQMFRYLVATHRTEAAEAARQVNQRDLFLQADPGAEYDKVIEVDLSKLEPHINGPYTPDASIPISKLKGTALAKGWPTKMKSSLIGSCTNSSYHDMDRAASIVKQAQKHGVELKTDFLVTPGSEQIRATIERDGQTTAFESVGAKVLANACGPCIGQWKRDDIADGEENVILTSFNRNFRARNDGNAKTMNFLASPEIVTCMAFAGDLTFNPLTDELKGKDGKSFKFQPPVGHDLPEYGFSGGRETYKPPSSNPPARSDVPLLVDPSSQRLQLLDPFDSWPGSEIEDLLVLIKVRGKCTTDHISAAGSWLKYKGHLENLSNNTLIGAMNDENGKVNVVRNYFTNKEDSIPDTARDYLRRNKPWLVIGDYNYGEGSAREHAALQPRYLGCRIVLTKSFARIHETNLKKQGVLPLTFANPDDYARIPSNARISTVGLVDLVHNGGGDLKLKVQTPTTVFDIPVKHTMSKDQLGWFKHGSALNMIAATSN